MLKKLIFASFLVCLIFSGIHTETIYANLGNPGDNLWSGTFEDGTVNEWQPGLSNFPWVSGPGDTSYELVVGGALTPNYALKITIDTTEGEAGMRWPRRSIGDNQALPDEAYYGVWFYLPETVSVDWWNFMQWKRAWTIGEIASSDPVASINIESEPGSLPYFVLNYKVGDDGNYDTYPGKRNIATAPPGLTIPVGQWVHLECYYRWSIVYNGEITCWQDDALLFSVSDIITEFDYPFEGDQPFYRQWTVNAYGENFQPGPYTLYIDDATIRAVEDTVPVPIYSNSAGLSGSTINVANYGDTSATTTVNIRNIGDADSQLHVTQIGSLNNFTLSALPANLNPIDGDFTVEISCIIPHTVETLVLQTNEIDNPIYSYTLECLSTPDGAPIAVGEEYTVMQDERLKIDLPGVLANDIEVNGDTLRAILITDASHGHLILHANGMVHYWPDTGFSGEDSFTYAATNRTLESNIVTVTINVISTNTHIRSAPGDNDLITNPTTGQDYLDTPTPDATTISITESPGNSSTPMP